MSIENELPGSDPDWEHSEFPKAYLAASVR